MVRINPTKPEWDTPTHGDFAAYVERLTAPAPAKKASLISTGAPRKASLPNPQAPSADTPAIPPAVLPPELVQFVAPFSDLLRIARMVLLLLLILGAISVVFTRGALPGLVVLGMLWWGLGWLIRSLASTDAAQPYRK